MCVMTDWTTLPDEEFWAEYDAVIAESNRRTTLKEAPAKQNALNESTLSAEGVAAGDPWRQPTGAHDAYPLSWVVTHNNKTWGSLVIGNVWEPGVSGWLEQAGPGNEWPDWNQPTGAHDAYPIDAKVTHNLQHWTSTVDANVWEPGVYGWVIA